MLPLVKHKTHFSQAGSWLWSFIYTISTDIATKLENNPIEICPTWPFLFLCKKNLQTVHHFGIAFDYVTRLSLSWNHHNKWKSAWYSLGNSLADNLIAISSPDALFLLVLWSLIKYWGELVKEVDVAFLNWKTNAIRNTIEVIMHAKSLALCWFKQTRKKKIRLGVFSGVLLSTIHAVESPWMCECMRNWSRAGHVISGMADF